MGKNVIWIDAAEFSQYGGWRLDTQFVRETGIAYLIADGAGEPVSDAEVMVDIPAEGRYRIWARTRNWIRDYTPGSFVVRLGITTTSAICGAQPSDAWRWEIAGESDVKNGLQKLTLHDLTGYYGRCAAIIITDDFNYTPAQEKEKFLNTRITLKKESGIPNEAGVYDVVIAGGGPAGISAALASARMGMKTALVHNRPVLGGNLSIEAGIRFSGAARRHKGFRETGLAEEIVRTRDYFNINWSEACGILIRQQQNLSLFTEEEVMQVENGKSGRIKSFFTQNVVTNVHKKFQGTIFIDCTGDGWPGYYAGALFRYGREASWEFDEEEAPPCADTITMSGSLIENGILTFCLEKGEHESRYEPPCWIEKFPAMNSLNRDSEPQQSKSNDARETVIDDVKGYYWVELPGNYDELWEGEKTRDQLIKLSIAFFDYLKNSWKKRKDAAQYVLKRIPLFLAKRESRRFIGDYILTENDCKEAKLFGDAVAYGGFPIDIHHPKGIFSGEEGTHHCFLHVPIYTIPFRSLYSINIDNLLFAGRNISATHCALGSVRVQATAATLGQAVGIAAALCCRHKISAKELGKNHIFELQQTLLKHDQYIPGIKNEDKKDLAKKSTVAASSVCQEEYYYNKPACCDPQNVINGFSRIIDHYHYQWVSDPRAAMPQWLVLEYKKTVCCSSIHVTFETDLSSQADLNPGLKYPVTCVTAYVICFYNDDKCIYTIEEKDNYKRKRIHIFDHIEINRIKIIINETGGDLSARINEIRLY